MAPLVLKPAPPAAARALRACRSDFSGSLDAAFRGMSLSKPAAPAPAGLRVDCLHGESGRKCMLTGKKANNGYTVSFSHRRVKTLQQVNLQYKRVYWEREQRWIRLRISTNALKTIEKVGLEAMAKEAGIDLYSLRHEDASENRRNWVAEHPQPYGPMPKNKRAPKWRPLGVPKPVFVPKWKQAALEAMAPDARAAALKAFVARWNPSAAAAATA